MRSSSNKNLTRAALVAALVVAGVLAAVGYQHFGTAPQQPVAKTAPVPIPPPGHGTDTPLAAATPPGTEEVPAEESDSDHESILAPSRPTESFGRAQGLHDTPDPMHVNASAAIVIDHGTGEVLAQKNAQAVLPIASITKLMTTLLVIEAKQPMDQVLTITQDDVDTLRHSKSRLRPGTVLTREEALHLALMSSENRAAHALARYYPGGLPAMIAAMNAKAKALGMKDTTYADPTGLTNENRSTARDLAVLVAYAAQNPVMRDFTTTPQHLANLGGRVLQYNNSNRLVKSPAWDIELQKTGYIVEAGRCMTMMTRVAGHELIMVLLDSDSNGTRVSDAEHLRRFVVAQNGWQDQQLALARARAVPAHREIAAARRAAPATRHHEVATRKAAEDKVAARHDTGKGRHKGGTRAVASRKTHGGEKVAAAPRHPSREEPAQSVAAKASPRRVRQTFAATHSANHS